MMKKAKLYLTIAFAAVCFALVWAWDNAITFARNFVPGLLCAFGGYLFHLAFADQDPLASFLLALGAVMLWGGALDIVAVRVKSAAFKQGADFFGETVIKVMQEQKRQ
ncbi:hypothetical protein [Rhizobium sp.]|uniref:hypothetical protein n=1 Tax=Rhizobium sp. TaxID=391 RepID=UPI0028A9B26C